MSYTLENYVSPTFTAYSGDAPIGQIDPLGSDRYTAASDLFAQVTRAQWEDYKARYLPVIESLVDSTTGASAEDLRSQAVQGATEAIDTGYGLASETANRMRARYGLAASPEQSNSTALQKARDKVNAINQTNREITDRNMMLVSGLGSPSSQIVGGATS